MRNTKTILYFFSISFFLLLSSYATASVEIQRIVSLVDYIGGDYKNAVDNGEIINNEEYQEMLDFSSSILQLSKSKDISADFIEQFQLLKSKIDTKSDSNDVKNLADRLKSDLISTYDLKPYPKRKPDFQSGKLLYENNCSTCHGISGKGDGVLSKNLEPPPTNFTEEGTKQILSPFKIYNTATFGIEGTAMPSFKTFSEDDKWDVSFYVASLGYSDGGGNTTSGGNNGGGINGENIPDDLKDFKNLATLSNEDLISRLNSVVNSPNEAAAFLRTDYLQNITETKFDSPIEFTKTKLGNALRLYKSNNKEGALKESIDAYLDGFESVEADISAKDSSLVFKIEKNLSIFRSGIKSGKNVDEIENLYSKIIADLNKADAILSSDSSLSSYVTFLNSFSIIVREALEAVLIIAAIIAFLYASGSKQAVKYIHFGWIAAVLCGFITWFVATKVVKISGAQREVIEGITSLTAAAVLFYVSYWLISKIEVNKWKHYIKDKLNKALNKKSIFALMSVSFLAVYREAFETVLFYQALIYQSESTIPQVIWGLVAGIIFISVVMVVVHKMALKIPLKYFFSFTSLFLYFLCFILVGKGIKELQSAGYISATALDLLPYIDFLGIYPTYETAVPQLVILIAFIFAFCWIAYVTNVRERNEITESVSTISNEIKTIQLSFEHIKGHIIEWKKCEHIDLEAEELDIQIHQASTHFDQLKEKLDKFNLTVGDS